MELSHGNSFLECAISGSPISQMTIMHAYQTCIKRIVRFANSLQVRLLRAVTRMLDSYLYYLVDGVAYNYSFGFMLLKELLTVFTLKYWTFWILI